MRTLLSVTAVLLTITLAACGGDDETTSTTGASGASGAQGATVDANMTASEFIAASIPDELAAVDQAVADNDACSGVDTAPGGDFQVAVAIDAASAPPDTPLSEIVADNC
jgi:hypothetical protein